MIYAAGVAAIALTAAACSHKTTQNEPVPAPREDSRPVAIDGAAYIPRATVFKMSGPYADKVAVTLTPDGRLSYFPAPSDITPESAPVYVGNGWWLNRQGIGAGSVFTSWTFDEYARLPKTPSPEEIRSHILPDAEVTAFKRTTVLQTNAMKELAKIRQEVE